MAEGMKKTGVQLIAEGASKFLSDLGQGNAALAAFGQAATGAAGHINVLGEMAVAHPGIRSYTEFTRHGLGNGAGSTVMPIVAGLLMARFGWRGAYQGIGLLVALIGFPLLLAFLKDPPKARGDHAGEAAGLTLAEAARTSTFWITLVAIALGAGCVTAVFTHVAPILGDKHVGEGPIIAVISTFALVCAAWQIAVGWLLDRTRAPRIAAPFYLLAAVGVLLMMRVHDTPNLILAGALMGIGLGTEFGALPFFIARYFGLRAYGAISGVMYAVVMFMQGLTPVLMDLVFDARGAYDLALYAVVAALVCGAGLLLALRPYASAADATGVAAEAA